MQFDNTCIPFSRYGSYFSLIWDAEGQRLLLRDVHGDTRTPLFALSFEADTGNASPTVEATPWEVTVRLESGFARMALHEETLAIETQGLRVHIKTLMGDYGFGYAPMPQRIVLIPGWRNRLGGLDISAGEAVCNVQYALIGGLLKCVKADALIRADTSGRTALTLTTGASEDQARVDGSPTVAAFSEAARREWEEFAAKMPPVPSAYQASATRSWYTLWSNTVRASGQLAYDAILMSKTGMSMVWSWDHCFNALALAAGDRLETKALEQVLLPFALQTQSGALPDCVCDTHALYNCVKQPVHGWCLGQIISQHEFGTDTLRRIYVPLAAWTEWWLRERDFDSDGVPNYVYGNEAWDNATVFDAGAILECPDLSSYLVLQMETLAEIAQRLGEDAEAQSWQTRANTLYANLIGHLWTPNGFICKTSGTHDFDPTPTSLLTCMPLVLGARLDRDKFAYLAERLERDFLTEWGPATESPRSPKFEKAGGYGMRGPLWAPITYLLADGLRRGGREDLAKRLAQSFCAMVQRSGSDHENYSAVTGEGRNDPAYTWTSAVNVLFLTHYLT
jgi:putative isomerase